MSVVYNTIYNSTTDSYTLVSIASGTPSGNIIINQYDGDSGLKNVTGIGNNIYENLTGITGITGNNIINIGTSAFKGCNGLQTVSFPSVTSLTTNSIFENCTSLSSISLNNLTAISGSNTFSNCNSLNTVTLPELTSITGNNTFDSCTSMSSISVNKLSILTGNYTFKTCTSLTSISLLTLTNFTGIGTCYGCANLTSLLLPSSVTTLPQETFYSTAISVFENSNITAINNNVFQLCSSLIRVTCSNLTTLGSGVFIECDNLTWTNINLGKITVLPNQVFKGCNFSGASIDLAAISINPIITINTEAFQGCLFNSVRGTSVSSVGADAFNGCSNLSNVTFGAVSVLNNRVFKGTAFTRIDLEKITTSNIIILNQNVFENCTSLVAFSGKYVTTIDQNCFTGCSALNAFYIGTSTNFNPNTNIFTGCSSLNRVCYNTIHNWTGTFAGKQISPYTELSTTQLIINIISNGITLNTVVTGGGLPAGVSTLNPVYQWYIDNDTIGTSSSTYNKLTLLGGASAGSYKLYISNYFEEVNTNINKIESLITANRYTVINRSILL